MNIYVLGAGSMGAALIAGLCNLENVSRENIYVLSGHAESTAKIAHKYQINPVGQLAEFSGADLVINATPVDVTRTILPKLASIITAETVVVSVAYGVDVPELKQLLGRVTGLIYMIPNIPVSVNQGVLAVDSTVDQASEDTPVMELLRGLGQIVRVQGDLLDVVSAGGGSAPAFAAIFVEALADSMVLHGLGRKVAYQVAEQMLRGTASLLLDRQILPAQLKDLVASPGGSTIRGVNALEQHGFRAAVMEAITKTIA